MVHISYPATFAGEIHVFWRMLWGWSFYGGGNIWDTHAVGGVAPMPPPTADSRIMHASSSTHFGRQTTQTEGQHHCVKPPLCRERLIKLIMLQLQYHINSDSADRDLLSEPSWYDSNIGRLTPETYKQCNTLHHHPSCCINARDITIWAYCTVLPPGNYCCAITTSIQVTTAGAATWWKMLRQ